MPFAGIEFEDADGGDVALINTSWLTPRKREVFWPPFKHQWQFDKAVKTGMPPEENTWHLFSIKRSFFEVGRIISIAFIDTLLHNCFAADDYEKAKKKFKQSQVTSDIQSEEEGPSVLERRTGRRPFRFTFSSDEDECSQSLLSGKSYQLPSPPKIKIVRSSNGENVCKEVSQSLLRENRKTTKKNLNNITSGK